SAATLGSSCLPRWCFTAMRKWPRGSENKREQFRRYLERAGVLDSLTNVLVALYEETDKPEDPLEFIKTHFGVAHAEAETLRLEISELQQKCEVLSRDNEDLRNRVSVLETSVTSSLSQCCTLLCRYLLAFTAFTVRASPRR
uniref:MYC binding protein n=1 Tax=Denticeps clupeoides TaxID=299321 RepID=A0AAY4DR91_9TELE